MNDRIVEFISDIDSTSYDEYVSRASIDSKLTIDNMYDYDYSWLTELEEYIPFISNIVNQDYSNTDETVIKSYENRFIRTLVLKIKEFLDNEQKKFYQTVFNPGEQKYKAHVDSLLNGERIEIDIKVECTKNDNIDNTEVYGLTIKDRILRLIDLVNSLLDSNLLKLLEDTTLVHTINKTEIFIEDINYRKSLELYNFLISFSENITKIDTDTLKSKIDEKAIITSYLEYQLLSEMYKDDENENVYKLFLERLIEKMVQDTNVNEKSFKKMLTKKFEDEYAKKKKREVSIQGIYNKTIDNYNKQVKDAIRALKS